MFRRARGAFEEIATQINANGPAKVLAQLLGMKAGQGPKYMHRELWPIFDVFMRDAEFRTLYGIIEFSRELRQLAVAAQLSTAEIWVPAGSSYIAVVTSLQGLVAGAIELQWKIQVHNPAATVNAVLARDSRTVQVGANGPLLSTALVSFGTSTAAAATAAAIVKLAPATATLNVPVVLDARGYAPTALPSLAVECQTINTQLDANVEGYLVPIKPT
jgi:hypothetical protein